MKPRLKLTLDGKVHVIHPGSDEAPPRKASEFLRELEQSNLTVAQWSRDNNLSPGVVWAVIRGAVLGRSGEARRAMQLMKLPLPSARRTRTKPAAAMQEAA